MTLRAILSAVLAKWEGSFDRAIREDMLDARGSERARGEFINSRIIDRGPMPRDVDGRLQGNWPRD